MLWPGCTGRVVSSQEFAKGLTFRPPLASQYRTFPAPSRSTCAVGTEAGRNDIAKLAAGAEAGMVSGSAAARTDRDDPARCCWTSFGRPHRSEEHTSELQSLMRISYAVFCLKKKKKKNTSLANEHLKTEHN